MPDDRYTEAPSFVEASLNNSLVRLNTVSPREPLTDLDSVDQVVDNSTAIGLGEPSHGTREVFQFKHRLFRYLVEEHGCRLFTIEANYSSVRRLNQCVTEGTGTVKEQLLESDIHGPWKCEAVLDLFR